MWRYAARSNFGRKLRRPSLGRRGRPIKKKHNGRDREAVVRGGVALSTFFGSFRHDNHYHTQPQFFALGSSDVTLQAQLGWIESRLGTATTIDGGTAATVTASNPIDRDQVRVTAAADEVLQDRVKTGGDEVASAVSNDGVAALLEEGLADLAQDEPGVFVDGVLSLCRVLENVASRNQQAPDDQPSSVVGQVETIAEHLVAYLEGGPQVPCSSLARVVRSISRTLCALEVAALDIPENVRKLHNAVSLSVREQAPSMSDHDLVRAVTCATKGSLDKKVIQSVIAERFSSADELSKLSTADLIALLHAVAVHFKADKLTEMLVKELGTRTMMEGSNPRTDVSVLLYSLAKSKRRNDALVNALSKQVVSAPPNSFSMQGLANMMWAFSKLTPKETGVIDKLANEVKLIGVNQASPAGISIIAQSLAVTKAPSRLQMFNLIGEYCRSHGMVRWSGDDIATILFAFANNGHTLAHVGEAACAAIASRGPEKFAHHELATILYAFGRAGFLDEDTLEMIADDLGSRKLSKLSYSDLSNSIFALARLNCGFHPTVTSLIAEFRRRLQNDEISARSSTDLHGLVNTAWASLVVRATRGSDVRGLDPIIRTLRQVVQQSSFTPLQKIYLNQIDSSLKLEFGVHDGIQMPESLWGQVVGAVVHSRRSKFWKSVWSETISLSVTDPWSQHWRDFQNGAAVVVDAASHDHGIGLNLVRVGQADTRHSRLLAPSLMHKRHLQILGWTAVDVKESEWRKLDRQRKQDYLLKSIADSIALDE